MEVLVTDGDQRSTLAVVRALGRAGIGVTVGETGASSLAGSSRYCARQVRYPSPSTDGDRFLAALAGELAGGRYRILLPMTDVTTRLVARRPELGTFAIVPFPGEEKIEWSQDKRRVLLLARRLGIRCPETWMLDEEDRIEEVSGQVRYPVVIKPRFSRYEQNGEWAAGEVEFARDAEDLRQKYRASQARLPFPMVQERIAGEGLGVFLLLWNGELKAAFCHRRLREKPPWGGPSVYRESIAFDEELVAKSACLLQAIGWQGPAMVEFKVDSRDGLPKLMEINGRFWGSLQLAIDAGMNFPLLLFRLATGEDVPSQFDYAVGIRSRWLLGDLDHLLIRLMHRSGNGSGSNGLEKNGMSRLRACGEFLKFYEPGTRYEVFRWEDRGPGWQECRSYIRDLKRAARRGKETDGAN
ncbi:MAG TPA: ATP-grasp domain-containing protein [Candidatus Dormibacteraeota bacterium]|nr:ATP-grasp domain-containing protein [Candidatus Dormibacteraeota bacterium]